MNKQEDKFFEMYRDSFQGFEPETPASIYVGVRKKMMWSNFMTFNLSTLNVWYLGLIFLGGLGTIGYVSVETSMGQMTAQHVVLNSFMAPQIAEVTLDVEDNQEVTATYTDELETPAAASAQPKKWASQPAADNIDDGSVADSGDDNLVNAGANARDRGGLMEVEIGEAEMTTMGAIKPETVVPFSIANALQIEMNDLVTQINDPNSGEINMKLPVTLPAVNE